MEAEFYSTIRPKRIPGPDERPVQALRKHGVEYVEVRCLDLNPFLPVGIDEEVMYFLNSFLLYCVLQPSPQTSPQEYAEIDSNNKAVVRRGREPGLQLKNGGKAVAMQEWANQMMQGVDAIAVVLDKVRSSQDHGTAASAQRAKLNNSALTPSARVLERMRELRTSYFRFAMNQSLANSDYFRGQHMTADKHQEFLRMSHTSNLERDAIESSDTMDFTSFLKRFNES